MSCNADQVFLEIMHGFFPLFYVFNTFHIQYVTKVSNSKFTGLWSHVCSDAVDTVTVVTVDILSYFYSRYTPKFYCP